MKIGLLKGHLLNPWEYPTFKDIPGLTVIGASPQNYSFHPPNTLYPRAYSNLALRVLGLNHIQPSLLRVLQAFDVVHSWESYFSTTFLASLTAKRLIFTQYETLPHCRAYRYPQNILKTKKAIGKASLIHCPTERAKECICSKGASEKQVFVQPFGVDTGAFSADVTPTYRRQLGLSDDDIVILFVGRMIYEKGIHTLLAAHERLGGSAKLMVCGFLGHDVSLPSDVIHMKNVPYESMPELQASADIFCLPSIPVANWEEQFGFVLVEAMAAGNPVVTTRCGAIPEVVGGDKHAAIVEPDNVEELACALGELVESPKDRKRMGRANRRRAESVYDAKKNGKIFQQKYGEVAG